jgi:hypothetical protein
MKTKKLLMLTLANLLISITCLTTGGLIFGQAPDQFNYQAVLRDASGNLKANTSANIEISILQGSATGTAVYTETNAITTNAFGLVNLQIGGGTATLGSFASIDWASGPYFVKISVDGTDFGTSQVLSVPYAKYAEKAGNGFSGSYIDLTNKPTLFDGAWSSLTGKPTFATVATSGSYTDLSNKPDFTKWDKDSTDNVTLTGNQTIAGNKTFSNTVTVPTPVNTTDAVNKTYVDTKASGLWSITGNAGTTSSNFIGTTDAQPLIFKANNTEKLRLTTQGTLELRNTGHSVFIGEGAGANDDLSSNYNVFIGLYCGTANTTGNGNVASGSYALASNTTGYGNVASGYYALSSNTTGNGNVASGQFALNANTTGNSNIASGSYALHLNTTGYNNVASGHYALGSNTTGHDNVASGYYALYSNTTGYNNIASGIYALGMNTTGHDNVASGYYALLANTTGYGNVASGSDALGSNTTGIYNVALGSAALYSDTTGNNNVAIGYNALNTNASGFNNTAIGYGADVTTGNLINATAIGYNAKVNAINKIVLGNASATTVGGYGAWVNYSDRRLKENIVYKNDLGLNFILKLKTVSYNYKADENKRRRDGLIAQDVEQTIKDLGLEFSGLVIDNDKDKTMNLSYSEFVIPLINAVQEQQKGMQTQQKQIELLKKQNEELRTMINELKKK